MATKLEGRANVLKAEVKQDGGNVEEKKEEIAELEQKAENATASQMNTPAEANKAAEEASVAEDNDNKVSDEKGEKTDQAGNTTKRAEESSTNGLQTENTENVQPFETTVPEDATAQAAVYTHVDVRL